MAYIGGWGAFIGAVSAPGYAVPEREFDEGGHFTVWDSGDSHGGGQASTAHSTSCGQSLAGRRYGEPGRVPAAVGDAVQPTGPPVGQQVLRRFEATLDTFREGLLAASDPKGSEPEGAQAHPAPNPYQALGLVGR